MTTPIEKAQRLDDLKSAVDRMIQIHDDYAKTAKTCSAQDVCNWHQGVADGIDLALHTLWTFTDGKLGVDQAPAVTA